MCYSKEFSLVSGTGMALSSLYFYAKFVRMKYLTEKSMRERAKKLQPFILNAILAYSCIAGHQFGEFFSILTGNQLIYKLGLISSIMSIYFGSKALEKLTNVKVGSTVILAIIALTSVSILTATFDFQNRHFWVRGNNHRLWSTVWFGLWTYAMLSGLYISRFYTTAVNKRLLRWAFLGVMNVSFVVSLLYAVLGSLSTNFVTCTQELFTGFVFGKDFPSIWCTFSVVQAPFLYWGFMQFVKNFDAKDSPEITKDNFLRRAAIIAGITIIFLIIAKQVIPIIFGVSWKMLSQ